MSNESGGCGGCLVSILILLVIGAAFGFVEWSTVGSFTRFLVYLIIAAVVIFVGFMLWANSSRK
jgi:membrane protein DedA with SNARE-associated domain